MDRHGDSPALVTAGGVLSYADLADRVAAHRVALGTEQRLVTLRPQPSVGFVVDYLAALAGGHAVLLTNDETVADAYASESPALHPDLRLLLSTSGSTGSPKLVRLSATNLQSNAEAIAAYLRLTSADVGLTTLPLDYCYGLSVLHSHLAVGASVVLTDRSVTDPALWSTAREHGVTSFAGVPYTFDLLDAAGWPELPSLRLVTQAGGRMAPDRVREVAARGRRDGFELFVMYGQTEATARMAYLPPQLAEEQAGAIGVPIPGGHLRVDPVEGAEPGVGELVYTGPNVMMGYAHSVADLARGPELVELRTGDLARVNDAGLFEIAGRKSRFAKIFGQRIDLDRVEALLALDHLTVACAGAEELEQLVVAVCGPAAPDLIADRVHAACGLPPRAVRVVPVDDLPRLPNGKVDQRAVASLAATAPPGSVAAATPLDSLVALYRDVLGNDLVAPHESFVTLGGDSLSYVELSLELESRLRSVPDDWPTRTIGELALLATDRRHRFWAKVETGIWLRAVAIVLIVGTHTNLFHIAGGAHVLLAVVGANFARFLLGGDDTAARRRRVLRGAARIAVPAAAWTLAVWVTVGDYGWRNVLLVNQILGGSRWAEPAWHFWFIEVVLHLLLVFGLLLSVPRVLALDRRHPFWFPFALLVASLVPRYVAELAARDLIHTSSFVAWLFLAGWVSVRTTTTAQRWLLSAAVLAALPGFFGSEARTVAVAVGLLLVVWVRSVPWPRAAVAPLGVLASSTLAIYLTHWQVYPYLEHRWPLGGLLASLALGVAVWWLAGLVSFAARREWQRLRVPHLRTIRQKEA
nr:non-ribosomal peptide synthetase [Nocardioides thalensis]